MADTSTDVLVAGYRDVDAASGDFESLVVRHFGRPYLLSRGVVDGSIRNSDNMTRD
jgi:hypothetical protein